MEKGRNATRGMFELLQDAIAHRDIATVRREDGASLILELPCEFPLARTGRLIRYQLLPMLASPYLHGRFVFTSFIIIFWRYIRYI